MAKEENKERRAITLRWQIHNFSDMPFGKVIYSDEFYSDSLMKHGDLLLETEDKQLRLNLSLNYRVLPIDCQYEFLDGEGSVLFSRTVLNQQTDRIDLPDCPTQEEVCETKKSSFLPRDTLTIRCYIWKSSGEFEQAEFFYLSNVIETCTFSFLWPIEGFSILGLGQRVVFPDEIIDTKELWFELVGESLRKAWVRIKINLQESEHVKSCKISVLDIEHKVIKCIESDPLQFNSSCNLEIMSKREILEKKTDYLCDDTLTLRIEITNILQCRSVERMYGGRVNLKTDDAGKPVTFSDTSNEAPIKALDNSGVSENRSDSVAVLQDEFLALYRDHNLSDFQLRSGDVSFPVHKVVLSARSPVFRAMFASDMREASSMSLEIPDLDPHTLNRMLTFLYGGTLDQLQWEAATKLYYAADKYQVPSLKEECISVLRSEITVSNVSDILTLAERHQDTEITSFVHDYILDHFDEIMVSEEWENFLYKDPLLAGKTAQQLYKKKLQMKI